MRIVGLGAHFGHRLVCCSKHECVLDKTTGGWTFHLGSLLMGVNPQLGLLKSKMLVQYLL